MGTRKRYLSGLLAAALALTLLTGGQPVWAAQAPGGEDTSDMAVESAFSDVEAGAWYAGAVEYCVESGLMNGVSGDRFDPGGTMTRSMLATVLYRASGSPAASGDAPFSDVEVDSWYGPAVLWSIQQGLFTGYGNGLFGTNDNVTREQLVVLLYRYAQYKGYGTSASGSLAAFVDSASVSDWATQAMSWAVANGIINGKDGARLDPQGTATRAEMAKILMVFCQKIAQ